MSHLPVSKDQATRRAFSSYRTLVNVALFDRRTESELLTSVS